MSTYDSNSTGTAAERTVALFLEYTGSGFSVSFLGEKFEVVDLLVQLNDPERPLPFFIQVKGTILGISESGRLPVSLSPEEHLRLAKYPAPTYLAGVDASGGPLARGVVPRVFLRTVRGNPTKGFGGIVATSNTQLNEDSINLLKEELRHYYNMTDPNVKNNYPSNFDNDERE